MQIRRVNESDYDQVRELRIAALRDSPNSFADTLEDTQAKPTQNWIELTQSLCNEHIMFILDTEGVSVGSVYGLADSHDEKVGRVAGMWVSCRYRKRGFGKALLQQLLSWAKTRRFIEMRLWAPSNDSKINEFYESSGFALTGVRQQTSKPDLEIVEMKRMLNQCS